MSVVRQRGAKRRQRCRLLVDPKLVASLHRLLAIDIGDKRFNLFQSAIIRVVCRAEANSVVEIAHHVPGAVMLAQP